MNFLNRHFNIIIIAVILLAALIFSSSCIELQVKQNQGEISECYYARYHCNKDPKGAVCLNFANECIKVSREKGCIGTIKTESGIYKDFNDCWKTRD